MNTNCRRPNIGVGVLVWRNKKLLLGKRILKNQQSCWQFPGGHLENNETVIDCAQREVYEETGLKVRAARHLGFTDRSFVVGDQFYITLFVSCEYDSGTERVLEADKCECWQWFDYRELPQPLFEPITLFLSQPVLMQSAGETQIKNHPSNSSSSIAQQADLYAKHCAASEDWDTPSDAHK